MKLGVVHILLVEDRPGNARQIKELLLSEDASRIITEAHIDSALPVLTKQQFAAILLNFSAPNNQSIDNILAITQVAPQTPIIVLTDLESDDFALQTIKAGAQDLLIRNDITPGLLLHNIDYAIKRKQIEKREQYRSQVLEQLSRGASLTEILNTIVKCVEQENPAMLCSILLLDNQNKHLLTGASPSLPESYNAAINGSEVGMARGSCGTAIYTGDRVIVENIQTHPYWTGYKELAAQAGLASCWSEPIKSSSAKPLGTFAIYHREPKTPSKTEIQFINEIAGLAAIAIERSRANEELQLAALVYQSSSEAMVVTDENSDIININPAFTEITGYTLPEVIGKNPKILGSGRHDDIFYQQMWQQLNETGRWQGEIWNRHKNGKIYAEWLTINTIYDSEGQPFRRVALFSDITKIKKSEELIWQQANFDPLTELPNRRMFNDRLTQEIKKAHRDIKPLALLFIDLDHFKEINDTIGHSMGDLLLKEAASRLCHCVRETDTVSRLGGDEFTIILSNLDDPGSIDRIANCILKKLAEPFVLGIETAYISASIGITVYPEDASGIEDLLKNADQAMYAAKERGRNRYHYFTVSMQESAQTRMRLANNLRGAIAKKQFYLAYHPIVDLATGAIYKAEALLRWQHPELGLINPNTFIPIAEDTKIIIDLGEWVFRETAQQIKRWRDCLDKDFQISINKSPVQFQTTTNCHELWFTHLQSIGLPGSSIVIEITERLLILKRASKACKKLLTV